MQRKRESTVGVKISGDYWIMILNLRNISSLSLTYKTSSWSRLHLIISVRHDSKKFFIIFQILLFNHSTNLVTSGAKFSQIRRLKCIITTYYAVAPAAIAVITFATTAFIVTRTTVMMVQIRI